MSDVNIITVSGRLTADPELRFTAKGTAVVSLRLASNHMYREKTATPGVQGELKQRTTFISASVFGHVAEVIATHKKKGELLLVTGRLEPNDWTDKDGHEHKTFQIFTDHVNFLWSGKKNGGSPESADSPSTEGSQGRSRGEAGASSLVGAGVGNGGGDAGEDEELLY